MSVAAILERVGFVPIVPTGAERVGTAPAVAAQHVPTVPTEMSVDVSETGEAALARAERCSARAALLAITDRLGLDRAPVHRMPAEDLELWAVVPADALAAYLQALDDNATRQAGRVPASDTAPIRCAHCGPVWVHPSIAAALPTVGGWPRALGCPWCHVRKVGAYIPRPSAKAER